MKVQFIELEFDEENKIIGVYLFIENTNRDITIANSAMANKFGQTSCATSVEGPKTWHCMWEGTDTMVRMYNFDGEGETTFDEYVYVAFRGLAW